MVKAEQEKSLLPGQFMKTVKGIKLIEFNVRFGDPEAMNVLPLLETNFNDISQSRWESLSER